MDPGRWQRIDALLSAALAQDEERRPGFLSRACQGDEELRKEVERLLKAHEHAVGFLETPPDAASAISTAPTSSQSGRNPPDETKRNPLGLKQLFEAALEREHADFGPSASSPDAFIGRVFSHYRLDEPLGSGGMGVVYRATDLKLGRVVAIKLLSRQLAADETAKARFLREARAASALDHPNIAVIHEVGEQDGELFIAMALYQGETLKQRLEKGALPLVEGLTVVGQLALGLEAAHRAGICEEDSWPSVKENMDSREPIGFGVGL